MSIIQRVTVNFINLTILLEVLSPDYILASVFNLLVAFYITHLKGRGKAGLDKTTIIKLYYTVPNYTIQYHTLLNNSILDYIIPYYPTLHCTIIYYT